VWLDRAFWGDPDYASVGWSTVDGRAFPVPAGIRAHPELKPWRIGREAIVLADYLDSGEQLAAMVRPHVSSVRIRRHPVEGGAGTLQDALHGAQIAVGHRTTALIEAALTGLSVVCLDAYNPVGPIASRCIRDIRRPDRREWAQQLAWGNWCHAEIESGELWACLTTVCDC
jgi:hypothetical protein